MRYSRAGATSIDLFVCEVVAHSRFRVEVVAECERSRFAGGGHSRSAEFRHRRTLGVAPASSRIWRKAIEPSAIVVQQHLPSAAALRARARAPIILQKHNFLRAPRNAEMDCATLSRWRRPANSTRSPGSRSSAGRRSQQFERDWPEVTTPRRVVANGFDAAAWRPAARARADRARGRARDAGKGTARGGACARRGPAAPSRLDGDFRRVRARALSRLFRRRRRGAGAARDRGAAAGRPAVRRGQGAQRTGGDRHRAFGVARAVRPHLPRGARRRRGGDLFGQRGLARDQRRGGALSAGGRAGAHRRGGGGADRRRIVTRSGSPPKAGRGSSGCSTCGASPPTSTTSAPRSIERASRRGDRPGGAGQPASSAASRAN